jgi:hypothetical protein
VKEHRRKAARVFTVGAHFIPAEVKKMNGLDLLGHTIRRPVILDLPGGQPWRHHIYVYD